MEIHAVKTWVDSRHGLTTVRDDVLGVVRDIKAIDDRLTVYYNEQSGCFDVVESCIDGTDRLVFSVEELDARVVNRLRAADHWHGQQRPERGVRSDDEDFAAVMDLDNEEWTARRRADHLDRIAAAGEELAYRLDLPLKGNVGYKESIFVGENPLADDQERDPNGAV